MMDSQLAHWLTNAWGIERGVVMGRPDDDATWTKLDEVLFDRAGHRRPGCLPPIGRAGASW